MSQPQKVSLPPISDILHVIGQPVPPRMPVDTQVLPPLYVKSAQPSPSLIQTVSQLKGYTYDYWHHGGVYATPPLQATSVKSPSYMSPVFKQESTPPPLNLRTNSDSLFSSQRSDFKPNIMNSPGNDQSSQNMTVNSKRKTRNNLPKETTYVLLKWLNDHLNHPYPNSFEKNQLMMSTGLNQQQLSNWFINARRRKIKLLKEQKRLNLV